MDVHLHITVSPKDKKKLEKVYKICNGAKKKYGYSEAKTEKCVLAVKKKFGIKR